MKLALMVAVLALAGCTPSASLSPSGSPASNAFDRLVKISDDRGLRMSCESLDRPGPSVVLVSGAQTAGDEWHAALKAGAATVSFDSIVESSDGVIDRVADFAPVCSYDRPGTVQLSRAVTDSTMVPQPTTAQSGVADLHAALTAAGVPAPYVLVGHSWGGFIALLFTATYPDQTAGLVLVDPATVALQQTLTAGQWDAFLRLPDRLLDGSGRESPDYRNSIDAVREAKVPAVPVTLLTSDHPFKLSSDLDVFPQWQAAGALAANSLGARHITQTESGHMIPIENPALVAQAIRDVTDEARVKA